MVYRAVDSRCAVCLDDLKLPMSNAAALDILDGLGFKVVEVDIVQLAMSCVGPSKYLRGASLQLAPAVVDCSGLAKWVYAQRGIWLPRHSIDQRDHCKLIVPEEGMICAGDLLFTAGHKPYFWDNPEDGVGHVGIADGQGGVIHADGPDSGVILTSLEYFFSGENRGIRRLISKNSKVLTIETPQGRDWVEHSQQFRWIILQRHAK